MQSFRRLPLRTLVTKILQKTHVLTNRLQTSPEDQHLPRKSRSIPNIRIGVIPEMPAAEQPQRNIVVASDHHEQQNEK